MSIKNWEKEFDKEFGILLYQGWKTKMANRNIKSFISSLLQKQRTELLEEIKKEIIKITDNGYDCVCSSYIEDYFKSLLNKKDE